MAIERRARVVWRGSLQEGQGEVTAESSGVFSSLPVTWAARTEDPGGKTSPEELLAAAHASCFSMAFSNGLAKAGHAAERLEVEATCTFEKADGGFKVGSMHLNVTARVPGIDEGAFKDAAETAKEGCPISGALKGNVAISLDAKLE
jgi:osmotically inducible protein OsmC